MPNEKLQKAIETAGAWARDSVSQGIQRSIDPNYILTLIDAIPSLSGAERHERAVPDGWQLVPKKITPEIRKAIGAVVDWPSANYWERIYVAALAAAPPPPAAVQETVAVKTLEWIQDCALTPFGEYRLDFLGDEEIRWEFMISGRYRNEKEHCGPWVSSADEAKAAAQVDYEQRIRSALSQTDTAPEISMKAALSRIAGMIDDENADLDDAIDIARAVCAAVSKGQADV